MTLTVIVPPGEEPVGLAAAKAFLRIGHEGEDALVGDLVAAARARLEAETGLALVTRTLRRSWSCWPPGIGGPGVRLRPGPAQALVAVRIRDEDDGEALQTGRFFLARGKLALAPGEALPALPALPAGASIEVDFEAGFGGAEDVPEDLALAVKLLVADAYRGGGGDGLPGDVRAICAARRELSI